MRIAVVMPAYNEAEGIVEFLQELNAALLPWQPTFFVVDDASRDATAEAARSAALAESPVPVSVQSNPANRGHGPSTLTALGLGLASGADAVIAIDGDGQFTGPDVARLVQTLLEGDAQIAEGVRTGRGDALYRRATSQATRALVWTRCRAWPADANTPLRAYRPEALRSLLEQVPADAMTPNLIISALCRRRGMRIVEVPVASRPRRGSTAHGSTWGSRRASLPSKRFIAFCGKAARQWVRT